MISEISGLGIFVFAPRFGIFVIQSDAFACAFGVVVAPGLLFLVIIWRDRLACSFGHGLADLL